MVALTSASGSVLWSMTMALFVALGSVAPSVTPSTLAAATGAAEGDEAAVNDAGLDADRGDEDGDIAWLDRGSLVTMRPLAPGINGLRVSGGFALALPFVGFEYGRGVAEHADVTFHYEAVVGLLHIFELTSRYAPVEVGRWTLGVELSAAYSFLGLASDNTSLTSTLYLVPELAASGFVSDVSELVVGAGVELDLLEWVVIDGNEEAEADVRIDALLFRFGWKTRLAEELDVYVIGRLRVPLETFSVDDEQFSFVPFAEFGGSWAW